MVLLSRDVDFTALPRDFQVQGRLQFLSLLSCHQVLFPPSFQSFLSLSFMVTP